VTDRHIGYIVALDQAIREDDAEPIRAALAMVKGVREVIPLEPDPHWAMAQAMARNDMIERLRAIIRELIP
jgi:hypothetical protein